MNYLRIYRSFIRVHCKPQTQRNFSGVVEQVKQVIIMSDAGTNGLSKVAVKLAKKIGGEIVVCDPLLSSRDLNIGVLKPSQEDLKKVKHHMVNVINASDPFDKLTYVRKVASDIRDAIARGRVPIVVGGAKMLIDWLKKGAIVLPPITAEIRDEAAARLREFKSRGDWGGGMTVVKELRPDLKMQISLNDWALMQHYVAVGLQIQLFTVDGLDVFIDENGIPRILLLPGFEFRHFFIVRDKRKVYAELDERIERMLGEGLLEEVGDLLLRGVITPDMEIVNKLVYKHTIEYLLRRDYKPNDMEAFSSFLMTVSDALREHSQKTERNYRNDPTCLFVRFGALKNNDYQRAVAAKPTMIDDVMNEIVHWCSESSDIFKEQSDLQLAEGKTCGSLFKRALKMPYDYSIKNSPDGEPVLVRYVLCRMIQMGMLDVFSLKRRGWVEELYDEKQGVTPDNVPNLDDPTWSAEACDVRSGVKMSFVRMLTTWYDHHLFSEYLKVADAIREKLEAAFPELLTDDKADKL